MTAGRERDDLLTLALALAVVPLTWWLLLGWSASRAIAGHDELALLHNLLSIREIAETGEGWWALVYRPDALGGFKGRDTVGPFPLFSLLATIGATPTTISGWSAFTVQALLGFLGCRAAADLTTVAGGTPRALAPIGRLGVIWLCAFTPALAWRLGFGHLNLVVGLLPFAAALALVAAAARSQRDADARRSQRSGIRARTPARRAAARRVRRDLRRADPARPLAEPRRYVALAGLTRSRRRRRLPGGAAGLLGRAGPRPQLRRRTLAGHRDRDVRLRHLHAGRLADLPALDTGAAIPRSRRVPAPRGELSRGPARVAAGARSVAPGARARDRSGRRRRRRARLQHGPGPGVAGLAGADAAAAQLPRSRARGTAADLGALAPVGGGAGRPRRRRRAVAAGRAALGPSPEEPKRAAPCRWQAVAGLSSVARRPPRDCPVPGAPDAARRGGPGADRGERGRRVARRGGARRDDSRGARDV